MTAGPATINQNRNYEQHHYGMTPVRNYEHHEFQPNSFQQRQTNYEATRIAKFGETNPFQAPASVAGHGTRIIPVAKVYYFFKKITKVTNYHKDRHNLLTMVHPIRTKITIHSILSNEADQTPVYQVNYFWLT